MRTFRRLALVLLIAVSIVTVPQAQTRTLNRGLNAASANAATHTAWSTTQFGQCRETVVYIAWGTGVASGAVTVEASFDSADAGTWAQLAVVTYSAGSPIQNIVQITGLTYNLRTRVSTVLAGGTVSTYFGCL